MRSLHTRVFLVALVAGTFLAPGTLWAGSRLTDFFSTCTTLDCGSATIPSTYGHDQFSNADPAVFQVFTSGNECVRIAVISQGTDLEATLTCPSGRTWQNDDGNGALRPLIKAITPPNRGWCTLTFSHFTGEGAAADFTFRYGRYPAANPNCAAPTLPAILKDELESQKSLDGGDHPRSGGSQD